jgi:hypothetical protein
MLGELAAGYLSSSGPSISAMECDEIVPIGEIT